MPSEEEIKAGMRHRKAPPQFDAARAEQNQAKWSAFQSTNNGKPGAGVGRSNTTRTPRKGFDPTTPGSDERPAADRNYVHRHRSEDFGQPKQHHRGPSGQGTPAYPPPPPPAPSMQSPLSPGTSPTSRQRPFADPLHQFRTREEAAPNVPFSEANRKRTPYTNFSGEKTAFSSEGLRRSASTHDATKLSANGTSAARARSTSPLGRQKAQQESPQQERPRSHGGGHPFVDYSSSEGTEDGSDSERTGDTPEGYGTSNSNLGAAENDRSRPGTASTTDRPKKVPTPSVRYPSARGNVNSPGYSNGAASDTESAYGRPSMAQKTSDNMYAHPDFFKFVDSRDDVTAKPSGFCKESWKAGMFGSSRYSTGEGQHRQPESARKTNGMALPAWAIPSSVSPVNTKKPKWNSVNTAHDSDVTNARNRQNMAANLKEQNAYAYFRQGLQSAHRNVPDSLDMELFLKLWASTAHCRRTMAEPALFSARAAPAWRVKDMPPSTQTTFESSTGSFLLDRLLSRVVTLFSAPQSLSATFDKANSAYADHRSCIDSFTFPNHSDLFSPTGGSKSRSEESINTKFTPEGWSGTFNGTPDYFAPPPSTSARRASPPRPRLPKRADERSSMRSATANIPNGPSSPYNEMPPPPRPFGSDGGPAGERANAAESGAKFSSEEWTQHLKDGKWAWPAQPPQHSTGKSPSPVGMGGSQRTQQGRSSRAHGQMPGRRANNGVDEDCTFIPEGPDGKPENGAPVDGATYDGDAMDIDSTPPAQHQNLPPDYNTAHNATQKDARLYTVPPTTWRQPQANGGPVHRKMSSASRRAQRASAGAAENSLHTNLDDLRNVEPFAQHASPDSLKSFADLSSSLPFPSKAAATLTTNPQEPQKLQLPHVPRVPEAPQRLSKESFHVYCGTFGSYLRAFHKFNSTMLAHFEARELQAEASMSVGMGWLEATGDTSGVTNAPSGFGVYLHRVKHDVDVREAWMMACDKHLEACKGFEKLRDRVRGLVAGGGLVDR